jgi:hypothetical protein
VLEYETNAVGHAEVLGSVPAGIVSPAPTDLAKLARMTSNNSLQTALAMSHSVLPVAAASSRRDRLPIQWSRDRGGVGSASAAALPCCDATGSARRGDPRRSLFAWMGIPDQLLSRTGRL